mgnify:CR=1 FL=1
MLARIAGTAATLIGLFSIPGSFPAYAQEAPSAYTRNCQMCHQSGAKGVPGLYPRLAGRAAILAMHAEGRNFLLSATLYGQTGKITVDGRTISGLMPPFARLKDEEIAAVLTYVSSLEADEDTDPFTAQEVAQARKQETNPSGVHALRQALSKQGRVPR